MLSGEVNSNHPAGLTGQGQDEKAASRRAKNFNPAFWNRPFYRYVGQKSRKFVSLSGKRYAYFVPGEAMRALAIYEVTGPDDYFFFAGLAPQVTYHFAIGGFLALPEIVKFQPPLDL